MGEGCHRLLSADEERTLLSRALDVQASPADRSAARHTLVIYNLRAVYQIAHRYARAVRTRFGLRLRADELVADGVIGLLSAIDAWDCSRTTRFLTYATYHIREALRNSLHRQTKPADHERTGQGEWLDQMKGRRHPGPQDLPRDWTRLTESDRRILTLRYGLGGEAEHTYREMAPLLGITPERCRQIHDLALQRLRGLTRTPRRMAA